MTAMTSDTPFDTASGKNRGTENFPVGSALIRPDLRKHVHAFYNFARAADDISDHPLLDAKEKVRLLDKFALCLADDRNTEILPAVELRRSLLETGVTPQHSLDLLAAFKRDAMQLRYSDWDDLVDYCTYSAAPVGRHVLALHGIGQAAWKANDALCNALQIINHVQDCADDYRELDRVYIPQDMLAANNGQTADLSHERSSVGLQATLLAMLKKMGPMLNDARDLPRHVPDIRLKCETSIICVLAEKLTALLHKRDPLYENVKLGKADIMAATVWGIVRAWL
jgi:squalene synthase HpnC